MFFEFRSVEETSAAIQLDGIRYLDVNLRIRRPPEFEKNPEIKPRRPVPTLDTVSLGIISTQVNDGSGKLFIGGLPREYNEDQVKNLLQRHGRLRSFHLVKETGELNSRGFGFCEYVDEITQLKERRIKKIAINYLKTWFFIDFFSTFPFYTILSGGIVAKLFRLFRLPKLVKIIDIDKFKMLM